MLKSNAFVRGVIGPVGSGKSSGCNVELLRRGMRQRQGTGGIRRTRFAVIRNTYGQLRDTTRKTFEQWVPSGGYWHEQSFTYHLRHEDLAIEILFRALDRPEDIDKLLSLELTGAYINEAREITKPVFDVLQSRVGRYPSKAQGGPSWYGIWFDTNPWHVGHWLDRLFASNPEGHELYEQPDGLGPDAENTENLPPDYYKRLCAGKAQDWIDVYVRGLKANADIGSVYGDLMANLEQRGAILNFTHPRDGVFTNWDLGFTDATGIWFWRVNEHGVADVIDHYEAHGKPLSHYFDVIDSRGYDYVKHWLPHDARAKTLATGSSILDQFLSKNGAGKVAIGPELSLLDGIQASRWLLEQPVRFHERCGQGLEALKEYRYEWDEETRAFSRRPLHNFASHSADAFRYLALVVKHSELVTRKKPEPDTTIGPLTYTLNDLRAERRPATRERV